MQSTLYSTSTCLVLASLPDLGLETALDRINRASGPARLARHEEDTILLREERVGRFACFASDVFHCPCLSVPNFTKDPGK